MERGRRPRRQTNTNNREKQPNMTNEDGGEILDTESGEDAQMEVDAVEVFCSGLKDIVKEIQDFKMELKTEFSTFKEEIKKDMREELEELKRNINQKLTETSKS